MSLFFTLRAGLLLSVSLPAFSERIRGYVSIKDEPITSTLSEKFDFTEVKLKVNGECGRPDSTNARKDRRFEFKEEAEVCEPVYIIKASARFKETLYTGRALVKVNAANEIKYKQPTNEVIELAPLVQSGAVEKALSVDRILLAFAGPIYSDLSSPLYRAPPVPEPSSAVTVKGAIVSAGSSLPVSGATVRILEFDDESPVKLAPCAKPNPYNKLNPYPGTEVALTPCSDRHGRYEITFPQPGVYLFEITAPGFTKSITPVEITAAGKLFVPPDMKELGFPKVVKLEDERSLEGPGRNLQLRDVSRRFSFSSRAIEALPFGGIRNLDDLALLMPGILPPAASVGGSGPGVGGGVGGSGQFVANGIRSRDNNFTLDGADNNEEDVGSRRQGFVAKSPLPIESISEYHVIAAISDAKYGRNTGAQVLTFSKRGGASFHGVALGLVTNQGMNARDFFNPASGPPEDLGRKERLTRVQGSLTAGGKLPHWPVHWLLSMERQQIQANNLAHYATPTEGERGVFGLGSLGFPGMSPASLPGSALFSLFPMPNNPAGPFGVNSYSEFTDTGGVATLGSGRLDHDFGPRVGRLAFRYGVNEDGRKIPNTGGSMRSRLDEKTREQTGSANFETSALKQFPQAIRISYGRNGTRFRAPGQKDLPGPNDFLLDAPLTLDLLIGDKQRFVPASDKDGSLLLTLLGYKDVIKNASQILGPVGSVNISGFSPAGIDPFHFPQMRATETYQVSDTVTKPWGAHVLAFGFDIRRSIVNTAIERNFRPAVVFNGIPQMTDQIGFRDNTMFSGATLAAMGVPTGMLHTLAQNPYSSLTFRFNQYNIFLHDHWSITSRLHLEVGVRQEMNTAPRTDGEQFESAFSQDVINKGIQAAVAGCVGANCSDLPRLASALPSGYRAAFNADRLNIEPRFGITWDPAGKGTTVLRLGFGGYKGQFPGIIMNEARSIFPSYLPINYANFPPRQGSQTYLFNLASPGIQQFPGLGLVKPGTLNVLNGVGPIPFLANSLKNIDSLDAAATFKILNTTMPASPLKNPYSLQFVSSIEQEWGNVVGSISYVGTLGRKLLRITTPQGGINDSEISSRSLTTSFVTLLGPASPQGVTIPFFRGAIKRTVPPVSRPSIYADSFLLAPTLYEDSARSAYHSLQMELRKRYAHGVQFGASFTWSHSIDDTSDFFDTAGSFALPQNSQLRSENGSSSFDSRFRTATHFLIDFRDVPQLHEFPFLKDWRLSGVFTLQTAQPFTVNTIYDMNRDGNATDRLATDAGLLRGPANDDRRTALRVTVPIENLISISKCAVAPGCDGAVGRNTFRATGYGSLDLLLSRTFRLGERVIASLRAEGYNVTNRAHFATPVRILEFPSFGQSVSTAQPGRVLQLGVRLDMGRAVGHSMGR